jgi:uncharacterized protein
MSEYIDNNARRQQVLKSVLNQLHEGKSISDVQGEFAEFLRGATSSEVAQVEQSLIEDGMPVEAIQQLCDIHVAVFQEGLDAESHPEMLPGHPIYTLQSENQVVGQYLDQVGGLIARLRPDSHPNILKQILEQFNELREYDRHYLRKENLLFSYLERYGFVGPSTVMWGIQNDIRDQWREIGAILEAAVEGTKAVDALALNVLFNAMAEAVRSMVYKEDKILFPNALERLSHEDWVSIREQENDIGYFLVTAGPLWPPKAQPGEEDTAEPAMIDGLVELFCGQLAPDQIALLLQHLPVDITFVDEDDRVRFFSETKDRIFPRSPAIIGRKVQFCHPPQSVDRVQSIVSDFRAGERDEAEFWIQMKGRFVHIRYFALRDQQGTYRGTLEVTQDITSLRALEGEHRILDEPAR